MAGTIGEDTRISSNATTQVKTGSGILHRIVVNKIGTDWVIDVYDDTGVGTSNQIASITPTQTGTLEYGIKFNNGLKIVTSGTTAGDITVIWE